VGLLARCGEGDRLAGFQTKNGKVYTRVWSQGDTRIAPRDPHRNADRPPLVTTSRERQAMLYAAPTGAEAPAPATEYILRRCPASGGSWGVLCVSYSL
jgi:hypothetical protein